MSACRRVFAVLIVLLWAVGVAPAPFGSKAEDSASRGDTVGVLAYRRPSPADAPWEGDDRSCDAGGPIELSYAKLVGFPVVMWVRTAIEHRHSPGEGVLAGCPRGPPSVGAQQSRLS